MSPSGRDTYHCLTSFTFCKLKHVKAGLRPWRIASTWVGILQSINGDLILVLIVLFIVAPDLSEWRRYPRARKMQAKRPDYGIDAPAVVRNLFLVTVTGVTAWSVVSFLARFSTVHMPKVVYALTSMAFGTATLCLVMAIWMLWESK